MHINAVCIAFETKKDLVNQSEEGRKLFSAFVQDRIKTGKINLWAPVKKRNLLTWKTRGQKSVCLFGDGVQEPPRN
ncbi:unnamed protein product [Pocillopora meandrina]|uniref:Uncharacterized protein n=1 Tax=Pocillopora meandrina TaxID=46732 RepID=A0AAU9WCR8_9CNID|nr:unnamed protein product [Pocillopora meandrina]